MPPPNETEKKLRRTLQTFDRTLSRPVLKALGMGGLEQSLRQIEQFHMQMGPEAYHVPDAHQLMAAGCRLSADLNEAVIERLTDALQTHDSEIQALSEALKRQIEARGQAASLLKKAQRLRQATVDAGQSIGLGVIL